MYNSIENELECTQNELSFWGTTLIATLSSVLDAMSRDSSPIGSLRLQPARAARKVKHSRLNVGAVRLCKIQHT